MSGWGAGRGAGRGGNPPAGDPQVAAQVEQQSQLIRALQGQIAALAQQLNQIQQLANPTFAFSPAQLRSGNEILNYENKVHLDIFKTSSASFPEKFDGSKDNLPALKTEIMAKAPIGG